jgi:hypothetical protein
MTQEKLFSKKVKNSLNVETFPNNYRTKWSASLTIPDQTMSMRELIERHTSGLTLDVGKTPIYDEDGTSQGINPKTLDLVDFQELSENNVEHIKTLSKKIEDKKALKAAEREKKEALEAFERNNLPEGQ